MFSMQLVLWIFSQLHYLNNLYGSICRQDGAESGYGAKAEEILGQVRGRYVISYLHLYFMHKKVIICLLYLALQY
jgi:hypothetical protein